MNGAEASAARIPKRVFRAARVATISGPPSVHREFEHVTIAAGRLNFHAVIAGPPTAPLVILLHGFPEGWRGWRRQIAPLAEAGFRVVVPDQRGYGASPKPNGVAAYRLDLLSADVVALAEALGHQSFDVVGHDFGGIVGWWAALTEPARVRRLVVVNAPHPVAARRYLRRHGRQILRSWYIFLFQAPRLPERLLSARNYAALSAALAGSAPAGLFGEAELRGYRAAWAEPGALTSMLNWYRAFARFRAGAADLTVRSPTLILWGDRDRFLEFGMAEASLRFAELGRLIRIPGASHWVQHEHADLVAREILRFLATERQTGE
jgi:pimeloyl-ACP methyl ester carboxylesterase